MEAVPGPAPHEVLCAECGTPMRLLRQVRIETGEQVGIFYACPLYPRCCCTHSAHSNGKPMGTPANAETRVERQKAHAIFDKLWKGRLPLMLRGAAYRWLAEQFGKQEVHIGEMDAEQARQTQRLARSKLAELQLEQKQIQRRRKREKKFTRLGKAELEAKVQRARRVERHESWKEERKEGT